ncbi:MAG: hypothetical protein PWP71_2051 [Clostridia bacterium]|jgi:arsenate reductase-like glutaredoxin family protein|nr:hypothetical protein [Clostridia bacterium]
MDINNILALDLEEAKTKLNNFGYSITEIKYLNKPPGKAKVVRIKEVAPQKIELLITYHKDLIDA